MLNYQHQQKLEYLHYFILFNLKNVLNHLNLSYDVKIHHENLLFI